MFLSDNGAIEWVYSGDLKGCLNGVFGECTVISLAKERVSKNHDVVALGIF